MDCIVLGLLPASFTSDGAVATPDDNGSYGSKTALMHAARAEKSM